MKKILIFLSILCFAGMHVGGVSANCDFDPTSEGANIGYALEDCFKDAALVNTEIRDASGNSTGVRNLNIEGGFKETIQTWIRTLSSILAVLAVGSIVYGSLMLVLSGGEEEKLKKGKDVIKWGILGFLAVIFAGVLITVVINIMFSI